MSRPLSVLLTLSASFSAAYAAASAACAAALVPIPTPQLPPPVYGLEVNKGQAPSGILFLNRSAGMAYTATSILYSPLGASLSLVASNPNPTVSFSDPLPGVVNSYTGSNPAQWISGIPLYATANATSMIYPGITAQYTISTVGASTLNLTLAAGVDPKAITFQIAQASQIVLASDGSLVASIGAPAILFHPPALAYPAPSASQGSVSRTVNYVLESATTFGLSVPDRDSTQPLEISISLGAAPSPSAAPATYLSAGLLWATDAFGNVYYATTIQDAAGKPAPFSNADAGCGINTEQPYPCLDVAVYKFSAAGTQEFVTYLSGRTMDSPSFLGLTPTGVLAVAGSTDSSDFPVSSAAYQTTYAGPPAIPDAPSGMVAGDYFAATLDPATGKLESSTYLGGPNADTLGTATIGPDGSLYLLPDFPVVPFSAGLPTSSGALQTSCQANPPIANPCSNGYVAHLSPALDKLLYGTYLPGTVLETPQLYSDGSLYYAGEAGPDFPTSPGAYQPQDAGGQDGIVARLDPTGSKLLFATYYGGPNTDQIFSIAVAPDASVWASVASYVQCCVNTSGR